MREGLEYTCSGRLRKGGGACAALMEEEEAWQGGSEAPPREGDAADEALCADGGDGAALLRNVGFAAAIERVSKAVVALRVATVRPFDGAGRGCSQATGFVVDVERGLILTNRHVVGGGPLTADATFLSKEEVTVVCVYR